MDSEELARYSYERLEAMLKTYRALADVHLEAGHYGLTKWCLRMATDLTVELNARDLADLEVHAAQLSLYDVDAPPF